jgi:hypothetical protein
VGITMLDKDVRDFCKPTLRRIPGIDICALFKKYMSNFCTFLW